MSQPSTETIASESLSMEAPAKYEFHVSAKRSLHQPPWPQGIYQWMYCVYSSLMVNFRMRAGWIERARAPMPSIRGSMISTEIQRHVQRRSSVVSCNPGSQFTIGLRLCWVVAGQETHRTMQSAHEIKVSLGIDCSAPPIPPGSVVATLTPRPTGETA